MASLIDILGDIPDPRRGNAQRHAMLDILAIALAASVCGAESCVDVAEFGRDRRWCGEVSIDITNPLREIGA